MSALPTCLTLAPRWRVLSPAYIWSLPQGKKAPRILPATLHHFPSQFRILSGMDSTSKNVVLPDHFYSKKLSDVSRSRKPSPIWDLFSVESQPGIVSMLAGKPNPATFPFDRISLGIKTPVSSSPSSSRIEDVTELTLRDQDLITALQYNFTAGIPELVRWVHDLMKEVHFGGEIEVEKASSWRVSLGHGSQDLLYKAFSALLNPGDTIIVEGPTYPTIIPVLDALRCNYAIVDSDEDGISASNLETVLGSWGSCSLSTGKPFPKVLYTVPFGSNPAGVTTSLPRRLDILHLARKYDLIILEDDPYYFLYYGDGPKPMSYFALDREVGATPSTDPPSSGGGVGQTIEGVRNTGGSERNGGGAKVDVRAGRVLRMDSFSKIVSAGFRLGWVTGPDILVKAIESHNATTVVQPSSLSQMVVLKLLQTWGREGFLAHTRRTAGFYRQRRDVMAKALDKHFVNVRYALPSTPEGGRRRPVAEWMVPDASMFFWVKLHLPAEGSHLDITNFVRNTAVPSGILVLPGSAAFPEDRQTACVRLSFSLVSDEEVEEGAKRLAGAVMSLLPPERDVSVDLGPIVEGEPQDAAVDEMMSEMKIRDSGVCIMEVPIEDDAEELVVYPRPASDQDFEAKALPPPPSSFSHHSSESSTTLYRVKTASVVGKRAPAPDDQNSKHIPLSSIAFPSSTRPSSEDQMDDASPTRRFTMRLKRASSSIGLRFKSLTRSPPTARLTESVLKLRTSVVGLRERARAKGSRELG